MFNVYIIKSVSKDTFYIGYTANVEDRIRRRNQGRERYTKKYVPWKLVYKRGFDNRGETVKHEQYLKSLKSKKALVQLEKEWQRNSLPNLKLREDKRN